MKHNKGQTSVEYLLIILVILVVIGYAGDRFFGKNISSYIDKHVIERFESDYQTLDEIREACKTTKCHLQR